MGLNKKRKDIVVCIRIPDPETWYKAKKYASEKGYTLGALVCNALKEYIEKEDKIIRLLQEIKNILETREYTAAKTAIIQEKNLPEYIEGNPWIDVLKRRRR